MTWYRDWFGEEYLDLYSHRNEEEARSQVELFCRVNGPSAGTTLDLACGSGRHIQEFAARGIHAVGLDLSWVLLRNGFVQYGRMDVVRADMLNLPFRTGVFSALVNFFTSFGYFADESDDQRAVAEMSRVLSPGAPFLFDYLNVEREAARIVRHERRETEAGTAEIDRWFDLPSRTFNKRIVIGAREYTERVRAYHLDDIRSMFASHGFEVRTLFGDFDGSAWSTSSPRLIVFGARI